ncbi:merozoite surface protein 7 (MSP7), putative [Plasmodium vivax]|uniref:Merozoite surface protein 7 (MSP7), putative n=2 Tax=Plasmodium vivax TaxID=5855 RepID=A5K7Z6_PLAVS|eukprot:XP_001614137.1 merozoite surface protein 7 (MSP7) [Plasmodium vivax Sal-1]
MKKKIVLFGSLFVLLSCSTVSSEKLGIQKKKKNLEQDATHALMKKLESLYKLSATDNSEIFNKEIESLKKQIDQLHQHGGENEGESLGHLLESEAANESTKKTIFGVDEDDLDNYDGDFTGQSKGKFKGHSFKAQKKVEGNDENIGGVPVTGNSASNSQSTGGSGSQNASPPQGSPSDSAQGSQVTNSTGSTVTLNAPSSSHSTGQPQQSAGVSLPTGTAETVASNTAQTSPPAGSPGGQAATSGQPESGRVPNVKYLDKLYDEVLKTTDAKDEIHVPPFHSKYNDFRKKYEFTMNEREYQIVKNLFDAFFKKDGNPSPADAVSFFKKMLNDPNVQKEFDNFVHGLYGFAKRHNYLRGERMTDTKLYDELLKNVVNLLNTIEVK